MKNIFVLAMDDIQRQEMNTVRDCENYCFHGVFDVETLVNSEVIDFDRLLDMVRNRIVEADVTVDAILAQWDFPTSVIVPILCAEFGVPAPSLESVLKCEHKYWSRIEQEKIVPQVVPAFCCIDPFDDRSLEDVNIAFPFWIKPVKSFSSQLGFMVSDEEGFREALSIIRKKINRLGDSFQRAMDRIALPEKISQCGANSCLVEEIISGVQVAPEGSVCNGCVSFHGVFDMNLGEHGTEISNIIYPSQVPDAIKNKMYKVCEDFLSYIGFDNGCFNAEFMWDDKNDKLRLIEFNTRISQSHSEMFVLVNGMTNHEVAIKVAQGRMEKLAENQGPYRVAGKFILTHPEDGVVLGVPGQEDILALKNRFPGFQLRIEVEPGMMLNQLANQDAYHFVLGELYLGADSYDELNEHYAVCKNALAFDISTDSYSDIPRPLGENDESYPHLSL